MKPEYEPKTREQILGYLVEEAGEVLAAAGKTLRWGDLSFNPEVPIAFRELNRDWVLREIRDLEWAITHVKALYSAEPTPNPSDRCGILRTKAEGGTTFTVCDGCWDALHPVPTVTPEWCDWTEMGGYEHSEYNPRCGAPVEPGKTRCKAHR